MKKKIALGFIAMILAVSLAACGEDTKSEPASQSGGQAQTEQASSKESADVEAVAADTSSAGQKTAEWPKEFAQWNVPIITTAVVTLADNRSAAGDMMTQGINAIVNLKNVSKADFDAYCTELAHNGFEKDPDSLADVMVVYNKQADGGTIKVTLSFSDDTTTVIANNSAAAAQKDEAAGGSAHWPASIKGVPEFTKGKYKETVEMGGNMFAITYNNVTNADLNWYKNTLVGAGFVRQEETDTEGYMKMESNTAYAVGFVSSGDSLQLIVTVGTF